MSEHRNLPPGHKGIRLADAPTWSVVVASSNDLAGLARCLEQLLPPCLDRGVEIVVARACPVEEYRELEKRYPRVLFMPATDHATPQQLRGIGLAAADGDIVRLITDTEEPDPVWLAELQSTGISTPNESRTV